MSEECNNTTPDMTPGRFGWNELNVPDVDAAKQFYGEVFGWDSETQEMAPGMEYTIFKQGDHMVGGLVSPPGAEDCPPYWAAYINSSDIAADVEKAKAAGATILVEHMEVPTAGELAVIQDPQGAVFSLWKASEAAQ